MRSDKQDVCNRLIRGEKLSGISRELGLAKSTISYWKTKLELKRVIKPRFSDWEHAQRLYDSGLSAQECAKLVGVKNSLWAQKVRDGVIVHRKRDRKPKLRLEDLLCSDRPQTGRGHLKRLLIDSGTLKYECSECGIFDWRGIRLSLVLDHINGMPTDNRLENLRLLCPNCNSLTDTFCGKNTKRQRLKKNIGS